MVFGIAFAPVYTLNKRKMFSNTTVATEMNMEFDYGRHSFH